MALEYQIMTMNNWIKEKVELLKFRKKNILNDAGKTSHKKSIEKTENEYEKFRIKQDKDYISSMDEKYKKYLEEINSNLLTDKRNEERLQIIIIIIIIIILKNF